MDELLTTGPITREQAASEFQRVVADAATTRPRRYRSGRRTALSNRDSVGCDPGAAPATGSRPT